MGLMKKLAAIIGLALVGLSIANVEFGCRQGGNNIAGYSAKITYKAKEKAECEKEILVQ